METESLNPSLRRLAKISHRYYTGRNLADGTQLGEEIPIGGAVGLDLYGDPTLTTAAALGDALAGGLAGLTGFNVTKIQTENVKDFEGIVVGLGDPKNPSSPQIIQVALRNSGQVKAICRVAAGACRTGSVPAAAGVPLSVVADQWWLVAQATSGLDTPVELSNHVGWALVASDTSSAEALLPVLLRSRT